MSIKYLTSGHYFIIQDLDKVVDLLIKTGADVNVLTVTNSTALHYAAEAGKIEFQRPKKLL